MAGNRLLLDTPTPPKWGRTFSLRNLTPRTKRFSETFLSLADHGTALMFTMIHPFPMFMHDPGSSNCRVLIQRVHAIGSEIIGIAFPTDLSDSLPPSCTPLCPMLTLATSDILASPHPQHLITLRNFPRQAGPHDQTITLNWL